MGKRGAILSVSVLFGVVVAGIVMAAFVAPTRTTDVAKAFADERELTIVVYNGGRLAFQGALPKDSSAYRDLISWLKKNNAGWGASPATYVPSLLVRGDRIQLNLQPTSLVYGNDGSQWIKTTDTTEYAAVRAEIQQQIQH